MVSWLSDGLVSGYDPTSRGAKAGVYRLASSGTVDTNGRTRLNWDVTNATTNATYRKFGNRLVVTAKFRYTQQEGNSTPQRGKGMAALLVKASQFPDGFVPTPYQVWAKTPDAADTGSLLWGAPSDGDLWTGYRDLEADMELFNAQMDPNTKYWLLVYPATITMGGYTGEWSKSRYRPLGPINDNGRVISIWTNRRPAAPIITSPATGSIIPPGSTFNITLDSRDPDEVTPNDAQRSNMDLAGVVYWYAPVPTAQDPDPNWFPIPYKNTNGQWDSYGARATVGVPSQAANIHMLRDLKLPVVVGRDPEDVPNGHGSLPKGDWQIRAYTGDFGHPWPNRVRPLGVGDPWSVTSFPSDNKSPWAAPVQIAVPTQVPVPVPLSPTQNIAIQEGETVRLSWNYRNTHQPPRNQMARWVQIRKVGDTEWSTVFAGESGLNYVDLPPSVTASPPTPPYPLMPNNGFEDGTSEGWEVLSGSSSSSIYPTNVNNSAQAHSGDRFLRLEATGDPMGVTLPITSGDLPSVPPPEYDLMRAEFWVKPPSNIYDDDERNGNVAVVFQFQDSAGNDVALIGDENQYIGRVTPPNGAQEWPWTRISVPRMPVPPGAATFWVQFATYGIANDFSQLYYSTGARYDDFIIEGYSSFDTNDFTLEETTQYEWRVRVRDTDFEESSWSEPARFWVVPPGDSGNIRPVPDETIEGATLGCGTHRVFVYRRGGLERVGEIRNISHVDWGRLRDDISTAKIVVNDWDIDCGNLLAKLQTWAYELVIFRDNGYTTDRVWEGPITLLTYEQDTVTIHAKDVMAYPYRRILRQAMNDTKTGATVTDRAARVLRNALAPDDPNVLAYLHVVTSEVDAMQYRSTPAYARTAYEEVDDMASNAGLDYVSVGRRIILWGTKNRIGTLPEFRDGDLGSSPIVSEYGMNMSNVYAVSDGNGVYGEATRLNEDDEDPVYGRVEMLSSTWASDSENDEGSYTQEGIETIRESFAEYAERSIADRYPPPVVVRIPDNTTLNPSAVVSIQQLIPGVVIPLRSTGTLRTVIADQKLDSITVTEENGRETITIVVSPFNRDDAAAEGEGGE